MFRLKNKAARIFILCLFTIVTFVSLDLKANEETIDSKLKRTVALNFKKEEHAVTYHVEIENTDQKKTEKFDTKEARWEGRLPLGHFRSRFQITFQDETISNWSPFVDFTVGNYKFVYQNLDQNVGTISTIAGTKKALLKWNPVSDVKSYKIVTTQLESYDLNQLERYGIKAKKLFNDVKKEYDQLEKPEVAFENLEPGLYEIKLIAKNAENQTIGFYKTKVEFYDIEKLKPTLENPNNEYVRNIQWKGIPGLIRYQFVVVKLPDVSEGAKSEPAKEMVRQDNYTRAEFQIPQTWAGGEYKYCVSTRIKLKTYSQESCLQIKVKDGDRSLTAENRYYQNILQEKQQQLYHNFGFVLSTIDYSSFNPSLKSNVEIKGQVINFSYTKSNPGRLPNFNDYYKINVGALTIDNKLNLSYDLRYGTEFTYSNNYPYLFKINAGVGVEKVEQAKTDAASARELTLNSHHLLNLFTQFAFKYDFIDKFAVDFRLGYSKPMMELSKAGGGRFTSGETIDYSVSGVFDGFRPKDKLEVGYLHKKRSFNFEAEASGYNESQVQESGHYISIGYIMETK